MNFLEANGISPIVDETLYKVKKGEPGYDCTPAGDKNCRVSVRVKKNTAATFEDLKGVKLIKRVTQANQIFSPVIPKGKAGKIHTFTNQDPQNLTLFIIDGLRKRLIMDDQLQIFIPFENNPKVTIIYPPIEL